MSLCIGCAQHYNQSVCGFKSLQITSLAFSWHLMKENVLIKPDTCRFLKIATYVCTYVCIYSTAESFNSFLHVWCPARVWVDHISLQHVIGMPQYIVNMSSYYQYYHILKSNKCSLLVCKEPYTSNFKEQLQPSNHCCNNITLKAQLWSCSTMRQYYE